MFLSNLFRRLMTQRFRSHKAAPIRKSPSPVGRRIEELEDRAMPATYNWDGSANLTVSLGTNESLSVVNTGSAYQLTLSGGADVWTATGTAADGGTTNGGTTLNFNTNADLAGSIAIDNTGAGAGTNDVDFTSGTISSGTLTVDTTTRSGTGAITDEATVSATGGGAIDLTASSSISESGGTLSTTGTLTTSSVAGTTLNSTNTVGTFNATNSTSGNVSFTNSGALIVTGISNVGTGTITVTNTGSVSLTTANVTTGSGAINLTATGGALSETSPAIVNTTGTLTTSSDTGTTLTDTNTVGTFNATNSTSGDVSLTDTASQLTVTGITETGGGNVTVSDTGSIRTTGAISAGGAGSVSLTGTVSILVLANVTGGTGGTTLLANGTGGGDTTGVTIDVGNKVSATGAGTVTVTGTGGDGSGNSNIGVEVYGTIASGGSGTVTVTGSGGTGSGGLNNGVSDYGTITSGGSGTVTVMGTGAGSGGNNFGTYVNGTITSGGSGTVTVMGTGGNGSSGGNYGTYVSGGTIASGGGNVSVTGLGSGTAPVGDNDGVYVSSGTITSGGSGTVTVMGTGGNGAVGTNFGVYDNGTISSPNTTLNVTGNVGSLTIIGITLATSGTAISGGSGNVNLTSDGIISEIPSAIIDTTGTLTTSSVGGTTLTDTNTVGTFNATNSTSGNVSFTNSGASIVSGISETGGTTTVTNTGSTTINGTGITSTGNVMVTTTANLTVSSAGVSSGGTASLSFGSNGTGDTALLNGPITGTSASLTGGAGNDVITINAMGTTNLTVDGNGVVAGGADQVNVNAGTAAGTPGSSGAGAVVLTDSGPGTDNYTVTLTGTGSGDTIDVNDLNTANYTGATAPFPTINTASGPAAVAVNGNETILYGPVNGATANLSALTIVETAGTNTYNVQYTDTVDTAGSLLPATVTLDTTTGNDTANLIGTTNPDTIDVGFTTTGVAAALSTNVIYNSGGAYVKTLNAYGRDETGTLGDTFKVAPDAKTAINVYGGLPTTGTGDTLILKVLGLLDPLLSPPPAVPNGTLTSNKATMTWNSIETFPIPIGFGGQFDMQQSATNPVQAGNTPVLFTTGYSAVQGYGWTKAPPGGYNLGTGGTLSGSPLANLLGDGTYGNGNGLANAGIFRIDMVANNPMYVTAFLGDKNGPHNDLDLSYSLTDPNVSATWQTIDTNFSVAQSKYVSIDSPAITPLLDGSVYPIWIRVANLGGSQLNWGLDGLYFRPQALVSPLTIARMDGAPGTTQQYADGVTADTYTVTGASPGAVLTVSTQYGTVLNDVQPGLPGVQAIANALGDATFEIQRPTGATTSTITVTDYTTASTGTFTQDYQLPQVRRIDFGTTTSPVASDGNGEYLGLSNGLYTANNALGWVTAPSNVFDRGAVSGISTYAPTQASLSNLIRDGVGSLTSADFEIAVPVDGNYAVTAIMGDASNPRSGETVEQVSANGSAVVPGTLNTLPNTALGQFPSLTLDVTSTSGIIRLRFGDTVAGASWVVNDLEVRPLPATNSPGTPPGPTSAPLPTEPQHVLTIVQMGASSPPVANGTSTTTFNLTGASPYSLVTISTAWGIPTGTDASTPFLGFQVLTSISGGATFTIQNPRSVSTLTGTIAATEVTGQGYGTLSESWPGATQFYQMAPATVPLTATPAPFSGATRVLNTTAYSTGTGFGWSSSTSQIDRGSNASTPLFQGSTDLYRAFDYGSGSATFTVAVGSGDATPTVTIYSFDSGGTNLSKETFRVDGGPVTTRTGNATTIVDDSLPASGVMTITIAGVAANWVVNGISVS